jgi:2-polyprenyl-6-methoxyphenol hydroxylase-like FAD-dependent oxidoreductase
MRRSEERAVRAERPQPESFDVIVVGARCGGSPLAALLARDGLNVAVVERAQFPRDTLSTHIVQAPALNFMDRLGLTDEIRATGAYLIGRGETRIENVEFAAPVPALPGDIGGFASVRRVVLDPILAQAAVDAGADVRFGTNVTGLVVENGRVTGVRVTHDGTQQVLTAQLVVGADGRNSTVAKLVGSRKYNLTPNERFVYWTYFEDADPGPDPAAIFHRWARQLVLACPADSGLYQVVIAPELAELPRVKQNLEGSFMAYARQCAPVAAALDGARRVERIYGMLRWEGFFREASGPGWVLVGDAGHFKDPTAGQGIADAFRQIDALAPVITRHLREPAAELDAALSAWGRERDVDAMEHYWLTTDLGKAGLAPAALCEAIRRLLAQDKLEPFLNLFHHRSEPSEVLTPTRMLGATARVFARRGTDRRALLRETRALMAEDARRKRMAKRPEYAAAGTATDAGPTEIERGVDPHDRITIAPPARRPSSVGA